MLVYNDLLALGVLGALRDRGRRVPDDVRVAGIDGLSIGELVAPRLTTLALDMAEVGRLATELVLGMRRGRAPAVRARRSVARSATGCCSATPPDLCRVRRRWQATMLTTRRTEEVVRPRAMTLRVSVIGTGYLGATHAAGMAEFGHQVVGIDVDPERIAILAAGRSPIFEDGLEPLLARHTRSGRLRFTTDYR